MLREPVSRFTHHKLTVVENKVSVADTAKEMKDENIDSVLVSQEDDIIGIVTTKDILTKVVAEAKDPEKTTINEITQKPLIDISKDATVHDAIDLMEKHNIRRLVVKNETRPIGIISRQQIVGNLEDYNIPLPLLEIPDKFSCPYCQSPFDDKKTLSRHIDDLHIGKGLLEGNLSKS